MITIKVERGVSNPLLLARRVERWLFNRLITALGGSYYGLHVVLMVVVGESTSIDDVLIRQMRQALRTQN